MGIPGKKYFNLIYVTVFLCGFSSCLKQEDNTAEGPKTGITIINAALNLDTIYLLLDNEKVPPHGVAFGEASGDSSNAYLKIKPGVHATAWLMGDGPAQEAKFFPWEGESYYTMITYDSAFNNQAPWLLIKDDVVPSDSIAKGRFINAVVGGTLSLWLLNPRDTIVVADKVPWLGESTNVSTTFNVSMAPGPWTLELHDENGTVLENKIITVNTSSLYSFVATGEKGDTSEKAPTVLQVVQRK